MEAPFNIHIPRTECVSVSRAHRYNHAPTDAARAGMAVVAIAAATVATAASKDNHRRRQESWLHLSPT
eukprot:6188263-Pleurochrysis_carterae.AAC.3